MMNAFENRDLAARFMILLLGGDEGAQAIGLSLIRMLGLAGLEGILLRRKEGLRLVVSIEILMRSVAVEIDEADIQACA